jgi:HEAT repeat protein
MQALASIRDERAASLFAYIIAHVDYRGSLRPIYVKAIEALGALASDDGVDALRDVVLRGQWYAPLRTAALRRAAALALARIGSPAAVEALETAIRDGSRGSRNAARAALDTRQPGGHPRS